MNAMNSKQLNPFELKSLLTKMLSEINSADDLKNYLDDFDLLDAQIDKKIISKILFKELVNTSKDKISIICFMLEHFLPKEELVAKFWETLKNKNLNNDVKIIILNLLRDLDADWSYETCEDYLDDAQVLLDENTKQLLNSAVINPEVQIDFMDFLATITTQDKLTLLNTFNNDFDADTFANILIPVFVSEPNSPQGMEALKLLGTTKSQLAFPVLKEMTNIVQGDLLQEVKRSLSTLKISGIREDNTKEFYKKVLSNSKPYKFYLTYPDGHGDIAMIFTRITENERLRFVSIVVNIELGIKDCFGFFDISKFECSKILERFLKNENTVEISPEAFKTILIEAEKKTFIRNKNTWKLPYEYVCWKNLLIDIDDFETSIEDCLKNNVTPKKFNDDIFDYLEQINVSSHWFLDYSYSVEFEELLKDIKKSENLDDLILKHLNNVFNETEQQEWMEKLLVSAFIMYSTGRDVDAGILYGLALDDEKKTQFYKNILKRSVYEYLILIKYESTIEHHGLTFEDIDDRIKYIEARWVANV